MTELLLSLTSLRRPNERNPLHNLQDSETSLCPPLHPHFNGLQMRQEHSVLGNPNGSIISDGTKAGKSERKDGGKDGDGGVRKAGRQKGKKERKGDKNEPAYY